MNDDYYNQLDYIRKLLDQQNRWEKQVRSFGMVSAMVEAQRMQEQFHASSTQNAIAAAQRIQEQINYYGTKDAIVEARRMQEQFYASSTQNAIAAAQRIQEQINYCGTKDAIVEAQRMQEQFYASSTQNAIAAAQRIQEQINYCGTKDAIVEAQRIQEQLYSSSVLVAIDAAKRIAQEQINSCGVLTIMADAQRIQEQLYSSSVLDAIDAAKRIAQEQINYCGTFNVIAEAQRMQTFFASSVITRLSEMAENFKSIDYTINPDGTITSQNSVLKQSEVQEIIESCLENTRTADGISFEITIDKILSNIAKQHPIITKLIVHILLVLFLNFISGNYFTPPVKIDYVLLAKQIKKEVHQVEIGTEFYRYYRFVSAPSLTVWSKNSTRSRYVGRLYFGYLVRVIHKKKNWSLIEYRGKDKEVIVRGWVFTRYIKRLD